MKPKQHSIHLTNVSKPVASQPEMGGKRYYEWKVFVDEDPKVLENIDQVTYFLHPTFPDPVRVVKDSSTGFALETTGWGEFEIGAQVQFKDGSTKSTSYTLDLLKEK